AADDLAGFTTAVDPVDPDSTVRVAPPGPSSAATATMSRRDRRREKRAGRSRRVTTRVVAFLLILLVVLGGAAVAIAQYARNTYYVGLQDDGATGATEIAIFRGKPDGVLWFDPTFELSTGLVITDLRPEARDAVTEGIEFGSVDDAREYLVGVTTTTTTAPTTSTSAPPTTRPTSSTVPPTTVPPP
nr:hypothetical protein [Acidimicrobiia bacterium]